MNQVTSLSMIFFLQIKFKNLKIIIIAYKHDIPTIKLLDGITIDCANKSIKLELCVKRDTLKR